MNLLITIFSFIALISLIVGIHELGHFSVARYFNIHVLKFKIGFGKELYSFQGKNDCKYSLGILPLGGYVQMLGENVIPEDQGGSNLLDKKSYLDATLNERAAVTAAGPAANFLLAIVIYFLISLIGTTHLGSYIGGVSQGSLAEEANIEFRDRIVSIDETRLDTFNEMNLILSNRIGDTGSIDIGFIKEGSNFTSYSTVDITNWLSTSDQSNPARSFGIEPLVPPVIGGLLEGGPASRAGLQAGDIIQSVNRNPINSWSQLSKILSNLPNETISISVLRGKDTLSYSLRTESFNQNNVSKGRIGIFASNDLSQWPQEIVVQKKETLINAFVFGFTETYKFTNLIIVSIGKMITGNMGTENLSGPIGIAQMAGNTAQAGIGPFIYLMGLLSISLAVLNLLPIPVLDGGQLTLLGIEAIRGKPLPERAENIIYTGGAVLVGMLMIFAIFNDIARFF